jgi:hypothetical protein
VGLSGLEGGIPLEQEMLKLIWDAVDEVNRQLPPQQQIEKSTSTALLGPGSSLDSLGFVIFLIALEEGIRRARGRTLTLGVLRESNPAALASVESLHRYITQELA